MTRLFFIQLIRPMCPFVLLDLRCGFIALDSSIDESRLGLRGQSRRIATHNPQPTYLLAQRFGMYSRDGATLLLYGTINDPIAGSPRCESAFNA